MAKILVVDDDPEVLGTVWRALRREDHDVTLAESVKDARSHIIENRPDLVVLDIMMPEQDGLTFCREIRTDKRLSALPILFLSARYRSDDIVEGLDAGGDDYLTKPFELKELSARVRALLRRSPPTEKQTTLTSGHLALDLNTYQANTEESKKIQLTATEFRLLHHLLKSPGQAHSVRELLDEVWEYPDGAGDPDLVRAHIRNLRSKLEPDSSKPKYIHTIHGVGYMVKE